jgi:hypothetical protein
LIAEQDLKKIVEKIRVARKGLIQQIRLASVGLAKDDKGILIDPKVVKLTDEAVKKILGDELGLDIPLFLTRLNGKPDGASLQALKHDFADTYNLSKLRERFD